jgi:hypothetical protein
MVEISTSGGAADKAACLMKCKSSSRQLPGFGRVAYPLLEEVTNRVLRGRKSHGRSVGSGNDQRGEQICGSEQERMSTASKWISVLKSLYGFVGTSTRYRTGEDRCSAGKQRARAPAESTGVRVQTHREGQAEITSGRTIFQQGLTTTCEDLSNQIVSKSTRGLWFGA